MGIEYDSRKKKILPYSKLVNIPNFRTALWAAFSSVSSDIMHNNRPFNTSGRSFGRLIAQNRAGEILGALVYIDKPIFGWGEMDFKATKSSPYIINMKVSGGGNTMGYPVPINMDRVAAVVLIIPKTYEGAQKNIIRAITFYRRYSKLIKGPVYVTDNKTRLKFVFDNGIGPIQYNPKFWDIPIPKYKK